MLLTTTEKIENVTITSYLGIVNGTAIYTVGGVFGGGLSNQEKLFGNAFNIASAHIVEKAQAIGADALVGVKLQTLCAAQGQIILIISGTAVKLAGGPGYNSPTSQFAAAGNMPAAPMTPISDDGAQICPNCGAKVDTGYAYCAMCGTKI